MRKELVTEKNIAWDYYYSKATEALNVVGKFMTRGTGDISDQLQEIILKAIQEGVTPSVKHTNLDTIELNPNSKNGSWIIIWYSNDDKQSLQKLAKFLVDHDLVQRTKSNRLYNIGFKYNEQTRNGEYGKDFKPSITLRDLIDLDTGEILP